MRFFYIIWITFMPILGFNQTQNWDEFNSSLLIEVTRPGGIFTCTGVAVSDQMVVTAAHCLDGEITKVRIFTQRSYDPKASFVAVKKFTLHPGYRPKSSRYKYDLAKIFLEEKLPQEIRILPIFKEQIVLGEIFRFGFGERAKKNIRTVITPKFKNINWEDKILELHDQYSYSGDSGGPIFLRKGSDLFILAVHSTLSFGPEGKYSYNPLLSGYETWIFEK